MRRGGTVFRGAIRWGDVVLASIASVSWAVVAMAGTAAAGLHLLGADAAGSLGPMTAAVVVLGAGGSVTPSGDVSAFGLSGAEARTNVDFTPLGVGLAGALLLALFFLRSLRAAGATVPGAELAARAAAVAALFVAVVAGLSWAGHDLVTLDGTRLGPSGADGPAVPGVPGLGDIAGLLPGRLAGLAGARARVGFGVDTGHSLAGAACWVAAVLVVALLASRRTPLPRAWSALHRAVRPAVSAVVTVVLVAMAAGLAAAAYAAAGDARPARIAGAALLGTPNAVGPAIPLGLFVPWSGHATGALATVLPDPVGRLLSTGSDRPLTLGRLAQLDQRVWLLAVAAACLMLCAGVLVAVRTPVGGHPGGAFTGRCALSLAAVGAVALPLLVWLTGVSANASLSVLGFDTFGAGLELHGDAGLALPLGAAWGAAAGALGALLARRSGAAGRGAATLARLSRAGAAGPRAATPGEVPAAADERVPRQAHSPALPDRAPGPNLPPAPPDDRAPDPHHPPAPPDDRAPDPHHPPAPPDDRAPDPHHPMPGGAPTPPGERTPGPHHPMPKGAPTPPGERTPGPHHPMPEGAPTPPGERVPGPYRPAPPHRPPNPDTNPYLKLPPDLHGSPTLPEGPRRRPRPRARPEEGPPPPPGTPRGRG
ncbi:streptophobe family protein [Streptomyces sp. NPDC002221]|uniref:streptophobe family protein n=1 Tax=Streptomyces sp. NPDC002221 TaxID=3364639 RepID=UPI0036B632BF